MAKTSGGRTLWAAAAATAILAWTIVAPTGTATNDFGEQVSPREFWIEPRGPLTPRAPDGLTLRSVPARVTTPEASYQPVRTPVSGLRTEGPPMPGAKHAGTATWPAPTAAPTTPVQQPAAPPAPASPPAPPFRTTFDSTDFDTNSANTGGGLFIPPDPHGAAGPSHVVNVANVTLRIHQKNGTLDLDTSLANFFTSESPTTETFDPKVLYDQYAGRFVVVTLEQQSPSLSRILVAVSDDSNPNGTWYTTAINSLINISGTDRWADYPGFAVDEEAVYITANMFSFAGSFGGTRLWVIDKGLAGGLYAGSTASVAVYDPWTSLGGAVATTHQVAHTYGTVPAGIGTFLVAYSGLNAGGDEFLEIIRIDDPVGTPSFNLQFLNLGDIDDLAGGLPTAPQLGSGTGVQTNDRRALDAVWRDNSLWLVATGLPNSGPDAGEPTALWWRIDTSTPAALAVADTGEIGGEELAGGASTFFPSIAVNSANHVAIGFSIAASSIYPSSAFTLRSPLDPPGATRTPRFLRRGTDFYVRTFGGTNRWGDYTGTALDPSDDCFWIYNQHAMTRGTPTPGPEDGRWDTAWGHVCSTDFEPFLADAGGTDAPVRSGSLSAGR